MKSAKIKTLTDREHILLRPEIQVGDTTTCVKKDWGFFNENGTYEFTVKEVPFNEAYFKLISEILDNSVDEFVKTKGKYSTKIEVTLKERDHFIVQDNGRGLPTSIDTTTGRPECEIAFTHLRAGSNFEKGTVNSESDVNAGNNGVGASVVNVLSREFIVETEDDSARYLIVCTDNMAKVDTKKIPRHNQRGTRVEVKIDTRPFSNIELITKEVVKTWIFKRLVELKTHYPGITFIFNGVEVVNNIYEYINPKHFTSTTSDAQVTICFKNYEDETDISFTNGMNTYDSSTYLKYCQDIIFNTLKKRLEKKFKPSHEIKISDLQKNIFLVVSLILPNAKFGNQNKTKLINLKSDFQTIVSESFLEKTTLAFIERFTTELEHLIDILEQEYVQKLSRKAKNVSRKNIAKFVEANSKDKKNTKLFIVEGDSAKAMFLEARNKLYHAAFPLKGKILNVFDKNVKTILENEEIKNLLAVIGLEIGKKAVDINYGQICILTDADPDGADISALLLVLFYRFWPELFTHKKIVKIHAPLVVATKGKDKKVYYDLESYSKDKEMLAKQGYNTSYFKGLGKMNVEEYREMLNNPVCSYINNYRDVLTKKVMNILFGKDTMVRKEWLKGKDILNENDINTQESEDKS